MLAPKVSELEVNDDEPCESIEGNQLAERKKRGSELIICRALRLYDLRDPLERPRPDFFLPSR
ncbi:hypothetical protein [Noviherbaspirillum aerium]|uniref:hypothetical protein n=1 Tax=Noviherbaspirillum aerium TaxID=2588497 RepID=UPI00124C3272|nr:hypothetical protein [Noviherbaspirillum aerium]